MIYLDLLSQVSPDDTDKRLQTYYPYIDESELSLHIRKKVSDQVIDKVVCGESCYRVASIFPTSGLKLTDAIIKGAAITGTALEEYLASILGDKYKNVNAINSIHKVICNLECVADSISTTDNEIITVPLAARCYFDGDPVGNILDGCKIDQSSMNQLTDLEMDDMMRNLNIIAEDIKGDKYDTSSQEVLSRYGNISEHLTNTISAKNSIATDICFITHFHRFQPNSTNYITYVIMDSETVLHPKGYECSITHDYSASDKSTDELGIITDDRLNGKVTITGYDDVISVYNFDRRVGKPSIVPVVIVAVRDDFKYVMERLSVVIPDIGIDSDESDVIEGDLKLRISPESETEYFVNIIH